MVVAWIEDDAELVGVRFVVTGREPTRDAGGLAVEQSRADIERAFVDENPDFRALGDRLAFVRVLLPERRDRLALGPFDLGQSPVDHGRSRDVTCPDCRARRVEVR